MKLLSEELKNLWIVQGLSGFNKMVGREDISEKTDIEKKLTREEQY